MCALSFETEATARLTTLSSRLAAAGAGVLVLHAAAAESNGALTFERAGNARLEDGFHATVAGGAPAAGSVTVPTLRLSGLIQHVAMRLRRGGRIAMKMDVEGVEGRVVPDLIGSGALCELAAVIVEWHDANPYLKLPVEQLHSIELAHADATPWRTAASAKVERQHRSSSTSTTRRIRTTTSRGRRLRMCT